MIEFVNCVILSRNEPQRVHDRRVNIVTLLEKDVTCPAAIHNLEVFDLHMVSSQSPQRLRYNCDAIVHQHEPGPMIRLKRVSDFRIDSIIILPNPVTLPKKILCISSPFHLSQY